jgi:g-D-glutamyl-meso-diaminopimelate peptidase
MLSSHSEGKSAVDPARPFGYREWESAKDILLEKYPVISYERIGHSVLGREIGAFRIGSGEREIHYNGAMHANEWMTGMLLMQFLDEIGQAVRDGIPYRGQKVSDLLERTSLWLVPLVNPDGVELAVRGLDPENPYEKKLLEWNGGRRDFSGWKANIRGVDLNDQFPAYWEKEKDRRDVAGPGPRDFTGDAPLSEPEAYALAEFTRRHNFLMVLAFHMQGREIYWNYRNMEPSDSIVWADRFSRVSGYIPVKLEGSDAGYKDWFIQEFRRPGFTVEAGFGVNPLPLGHFGGIHEETAAIMLEGLKG